MFPSFAFLAAALALAVVPGPGMAYVVARTTAGGRAEGIASSVGTAGGGLLHVLASALGLSVLVAASPLLQATMRYVGAAYLLYLGLRILLARRDTSTSLPAVKRTGPWKAFRDGIVVEALNVKTAMFFIAFIPQFIASDRAFAPQFVLLGSICVVFNTLADLAAVMAASRFVAGAGARASRERWLSRVSGVVMLMLGAYIAFAEVG